MATDAPPSKEEPSQEEHRLLRRGVLRSAAERRVRRTAPLLPFLAFPLTVAFVAWYLLYVLLSNYAGGFMGTKLFGNINVAFVFGIAQFVTTFLIAWWYSRHAAAKLDPKAEAIKTRMEGGA